MDTAKLSRHLSATPAAAWAAAQRPADLAAAMPDVDKAEVVATREEGDTLVQTVRWQGWLKAGAIRRQMVWTEDDRWRESDLSCAFTQVEGNFKEYGGQWSFAADKGGCLVTITLDYDAGIPLVGPLIQTLVKRIVVQNLEALLAGLAAVLEE